MRKPEFTSLGLNEDSSEQGNKSSLKERLRSLFSRNANLEHNGAPTPEESKQDTSGPEAENLENREKEQVNETGPEHAVSENNTEQVAEREKTPEEALETINALAKEANANIIRTVEENPELAAQVSPEVLERAKSPAAAEVLAGEIQANPAWKKILSGPAKDIALGVVTGASIRFVTKHSLNYLLPGSGYVAAGVAGGAAAGVRGYRQEHKRINALKEAGETTKLASEYVDLLEQAGSKGSDESTLGRLKEIATALKEREFEGLKEGSKLQALIETREGAAGEGLAKDKETKQLLKEVSRHYSTKTQLRQVAKSVLIGMGSGAIGSAAVEALAGYLETAKDAAMAAKEAAAVASSGKEALRDAAEQVPLQHTVEANAAVSDSIALEKGSSIWKTTKAFLAAHGIENSEGNIRKAVKDVLVRENGVSVAGWGEKGELMDTAMQPGHEVKGFTKVLALFGKKVSETITVTEGFRPAAPDLNTAIPEKLESVPNPVASIARSVPWKMLGAGAAAVGIVTALGYGTYRAVRSRGKSVSESPAEANDHSSKGQDKVPETHSQPRSESTTPSVEGTGKTQPSPTPESVPQQPSVPEASAKPAGEAKLTPEQARDPLIAGNANYVSGTADDEAREVQERQQAYEKEQAQQELRYNQELEKTVSQIEHLLGVKLVMEGAFAQQKKRQQLKALDRLREWAASVQENEAVLKLFKDKGNLVISDQAQKATKTALYIEESVLFEADAKERLGTIVAAMLPKQRVKKVTSEVAGSRKNDSERGDSKQEAIEILGDIKKKTGADVVFSSEFESFADAPIEKVKAAAALHNWVEAAISKPNLKTSFSKLKIIKLGGKRLHVSRRVLYIPIADVPHTGRFKKLNDTLLTAQWGGAPEPGKSQQRGKSKAAR